MSYNSDLIYTRRTMQEEEFKKVLKSLFSKEEKSPFAAIKELYHQKEDEATFYKNRFEKTKPAFQKLLCELKNKELALASLTTEIQSFEEKSQDLKAQYDEKISELKKTMDIQKDDHEKVLLDLKESFEEKESLFEREKEKVLDFENERRHLVERLAMALSEMQRLSEEKSNEEIIENAYNQLQELKKRNQQLENELEKVFRLLGKKLRIIAALKKNEENNRH